MWFKRNASSLTANTSTTLRPATAAKLLSKDEARRASIAKLPELLKKA